MKMSDILHNIADMLDKAEGGAAPLNTEKSADDFQHDVHDGAEQAGSDVEVGKFVPPLQAKLELLKKATGVESEYDDEGDELGAIKKLSGIHPIAVHIASEDNDITG